MEALDSILLLSASGPSLGRVIARVMYIRVADAAAAMFTCD
jgi:hypothetical protein